MSKNTNVKKAQNSPYSPDFFVESDKIWDVGKEFREYKRAEKAIKKARVEKIPEPKPEIKTEIKLKQKSLPVPMPEPKKALQSPTKTFFIPSPDTESTREITEGGAFRPNFTFESDKHWDLNEIDRSIPKHYKDAEEHKIQIVTRKDLCDWCESLIGTAASVIIVLVFIARLNQVHGISMLPTLTEGDRLIVTPIFWELDYGDIVVLEAPNLQNSQTGAMGEPIVKRVIGLPGDVIYISRQSGEVFRNGERLEELYIMEEIHPFKVGNQVYPLTVGENNIFVMGDNRNFSTDSRAASGSGITYYVGCVDINRVVGKAVFRVYPFENFGGL
jgi:signal peptidase I